MEPSLSVRSVWTDSAQVKDPKLAVALLTVVPKRRREGADDDAKPLYQWENSVMDQARCDLEPSDPLEMRSRTVRSP